MGNTLTLRGSFRALAFVSIAFLAGCSGGGGDNGGTALPGDPADEPAQVRARAEGEAVPGQLVRLVADAPEGATFTALSWAQSGGPAVSLENSESNIARFRVPPVAEDTEFSFTLTATDADGTPAHRHVRFRVGALSWKKLRLVETALGEDFVVFRADKDMDERIELYRAGLDGGDVVRLNGPLIPGGNVQSFSISPDGDYVAYLADEDTLGRSELYVVDSDGGDSTRVSGALIAGGNVTEDFLWSPDSTAVAYRADQNVDERFELFAAFADGSASIRLSGDLTDGGDVVAEDFFWSADSRRIAYRADRFTNDVLELFVSRADGSDNARVSAPLTPGGGVLGNFAWAPAERTIAYIADRNTVGVFELFAVDDDGGAHRNLSGSLISDGSVLDLAWAPDGSRVAYRAEKLTDDVIELFSVLPDGGDNTQVARMRSGGDVGAYAWAPDSAAIAYLADQETDGVVELFIAGPQGQANRRVSGPLVADGEVGDFAWSPKGDYVAYRADQLADGVLELFTSLPSGGVNVRVSGDLPVGGDVLNDWQWSPDGDWLAYRADQRTVNVIELFTAAPDGSGQVLVGAIMAPGGEVVSIKGRAFGWLPNGTRLVYSADQRTNNVFELFVAAPDGGTVNASISGPLTSGGDVIEFGLASVPGMSAGCDPATEVLHDGRCFHLDGSGGVCELGYELAPQSVLGDIAAQFVGKTYRTTRSNNCCISHAEQATELQDWGMESIDCNIDGTFNVGPGLGAAGCTDANNDASSQLTLCRTAR